MENVQKLIRKDEPPKIIYTSVKVEKTAQLDRDNDRVYQANLKVLIQIKELQTQCKAHGTPDQLLKLVASIGQACRQLCEGFFSWNHLCGYLDGKPRKSFFI